MTEKEYRQTRFTPPAGATEILLVRHGESRAARVDEPFPLVDGQGDPELAPQGRNQAELVGARLSALPIDAVYVTKLQRTSETAAPLCRLTGLVPTLNPDLHEVHLGDDRATPCGGTFCIFGFRQRRWHWRRQSDNRALLGHC